MEAWTVFIAWFALLVSVIALGFAIRQTKAAESSARSARNAERRALKLERKMAFRWEIATNGRDRYLLSNKGMRVAHKVSVTLPDYMDGVQLHVDKMKPLELGPFEARVNPGYQANVELTLPRTVIITWEDHDEKTPVRQSLNTSLPDHNPA
ncbi:UNVERIFIED_CONTAM: hypothetical protein ABIE34_000462 [Jeotgalibacillus campisalis]